MTETIGEPDLYRFPFWMENMEQYLRVGTVTTTHGLQGEVKVYPSTDDPGRFKKLKKVLLAGRGGYQPLTISQVRFSKNLVLLKFEGYDRVEDVTAFRGKELYVERADAVQLGPDEYYIGDLIGMEVYLEDGTQLGILKDVIETGANDVYQVERTGAKEVLIPAIRQCVLQVNPEENRMTVHLLEGMLE